MVQRGQIPAPIKIGNLTRWELNELGIVGEQESPK
jgi:predicted DNA-binding transcriptional regulator AlpA